MSTDIKINIIDRENKTHQVDAPTDMGMNLMELCRAHELPVEGICGGMAMCSTCHVYVLSETILPSPSDDEIDLLERGVAFKVQKNSRLGCQIKLTPEIDGLKVQLAPER